MVHNPESFLAVSQGSVGGKKRLRSRSKKSEANIEEKSYTFVFRDGALMKSQEIKSASDLSVTPLSFQRNVLAYHKPRRSRR